MANVDAVRPEEGTLSPRHARLVLPVVGLSLMAVISAVSGLNVALPSMARETGATQSELTWIVDAYTVVFAGLLLFAGALGDRFGRRRLLLVGLAIFGGAAALGVVTTEPTQLIAVRMLMGVGAAAVMPTTLSVITTSFPEAERPKAIGVWVAIAGGGAVLGLFVTGLLLEWFPWTSFFALNVTLAVLGFVGVLAVIPESSDPSHRLDVVGGVLSLVAVASIVFGIIEGPERGWGDPGTVGALIVGVVALVAFLVWEARQPYPLLDPRLFRVRGFSAGALTILVQFLSAFGFFFISLQYLQYVTGRSPLEAAVALLPLPFVLLPTARRAPLIAQRLGFRRLGPLGLVLGALGFLVFSRLDVDTPYWWFLIGLVLFGLGMGLAGTPATTAITASLPMAKQGVASAVNDTSRELGSAIGIAVLGSVLNQAYRDGMLDAVAGLPPAIAERVLGSIAFTSAPQVAQMGEMGRQLVDAARAAFVSGVGTSVFVVAGILLVAAVAVAVIAPRGTTQPATPGLAVRESLPEAVPELAADGPLGSSPEA